MKVPFILIALAISLSACGSQPRHYDAVVDELVYDEKEIFADMGRNEFAEAARLNPEEFCEPLPHSATVDLEDLMTFGRLTYSSGTLTTALLLEGSAMRPHIVWVRHSDYGVNRQRSTSVDSCYYV